MAELASPVPGFLVGLSVLGLLYGIFFCLFCWSTYISIQRHVQRNAYASPGGKRTIWKAVPFVGNILLFVAITPLWILMTCESFQAFVFFDAGKAPLLFYYGSSDGLKGSLAMSILIEFVLFIGDLIMIYRLYLLWGGSRPIVLLPALALIGFLVCDGFIEYYISRNTEGVAYAVYQQLKAIIPVECALSLFINVYCCALMSWKLYQHLPTQAYVARRIRLTNIIVIFIESAGLYVIFMAIWLGTYASGSPVDAVMGESLVAITGIAFTLVNIRVDMEYRAQADPDGIPTTYRSGQLRVRTQTFAEGTVVLDGTQGVEFFAWSAGPLR